MNKQVSLIAHEHHQRVSFVVEIKVSAFPSKGLKFSYFSSVNGIKNLN